MRGVREAPDPKRRPACIHCQSTMVNGREKCDATDRSHSAQRIADRPRAAGVLSAQDASRGPREMSQHQEFQCPLFLSIYSSYSRAT